MDLNNLNMYVEFDAESDFEVERTYVLRLDPDC